MKRTRHKSEDRVINKSTFTIKTDIITDSDLSKSPISLGKKDMFEVNQIPEIEEESL